MVECLYITIGRVLARMNGALLFEDNDSYERWALAFDRLCDALDGIPVYARGKSRIARNYGISEMQS